MLKRTLGLLAAVAILGASATQSFGAILLPGGTLFPLAGEPDLPVGTLVISSGAVPFATSTFSGTLTSEVWIADPTNPFGPGGHTFTYLLTNSPASINVLERLTVTDFAGFLTDVSWQSPGPPGLPPAYAVRTTPDVIGFTFANPPIGPGVIAPGVTSARLIVQTNATTYTPSLAHVIDGDVVSVFAYAPAPGAGVPEPASLSVLGLGIAALLIRRRRNQGSC